MDCLQTWFQFFLHCCSLSSDFQEARMDEASSSTTSHTVESERPQPCGCQISSSLFKLYGPEPPQINSIDIILFHGLQFEHNSDAYLSTWKSGDASQEVWPQTWLSAKYPEARIILVSYDAAIQTSGTKGRMNMHIIGENLLQDILRLRKKQGKECPVILVGHSFGGLVVKQLCVHAHRNKGTSGNGQDIRKFLESIRGIFFYATPHRGIDTAVMSKVLSRMSPNKSLLSFVELLGEDAARLHEEFVQLWREYKWLLYGVGELHPMEGERNLFVKDASSRFGDKYITVESNHFSVCRPVSKKCSRYLHLVDLIDAIYDQKSKEERRNHEHIFKNVMGLEPLVAEVQELLKEHTFLGFCGMGGVGKTTIAMATFKTLSVAFEYTCFVYEVKLIQGNKEEIKKKIWENMRHRDSRSVPTTADVMGRKVLIVFDDIDKREHAVLLQEMADDYASEESRFITTSRDADVLRLLPGNYIYPVEILEPQVARELFIAHAFPGLRDPPEHLKPNVEKVVEGCAGLPLTLEVVGKFLHKQTSVKIWDNILDALTNAETLPTLEERVWRKVEVSYDNLDEFEQQMFLDIASFLLLEGCPFSLEEAKTAWSSMFKYVDTRWKRLVDMSLIQEESIITRYWYGDPDLSLRIEDGDEVRIVRMHEHLRSMGQRIAKKTGRYSSMMDSLCGGNIHPEKVVALSANFSDDWMDGDMEDSDGDMDGSCDKSCSLCKVQKFFSQLEGLRYLDLNLRSIVPCERCRTSGGFSLPGGLVMFRWGGSNVDVKLSLEASVCRSLAVLRLDRDDDCSLDILSPQACRYMSRLERLTMWNGVSRLPNAFGRLSSLKHLEISQCAKLEELPVTFGNLSSLERLEIFGCDVLERLPESFGNMGRSLKHLAIVQCAKLQGLPETFGNLSSLERLKIVGCYLLERLPESFGNMGRSLKHLEISFCAKLQGLPETFGNLSSLERLEIRECDVLERLPESFGNMGRSLKHLEISFCAKLQGLPETFGNLSSLERLELERCDVLERLPESIVNIGPSLEHLEISGCAKLQGLPETFGNLSRLERLELKRCDVLERLPESIVNIGPSLKHLEIWWCAKLQGLPETFGNLSSLERLKIVGCYLLERLPENLGNMGRSLKHLEISFCAKLQGLPETFGNLSSLERLKIVGCYLLERLPESFGNMGRSLKHLEISFCAKLQGLPETFGNLSSLERLEIRECDVLERLPESFGNMGRSLKHLEISFCAKLQGLPETFGNLSSLERLELERCDVLERLPESFVNIGPSLKHLEISGCAKLQGLPETFGNLSSLERLKIVGCYLLERLPESFGNMGRSLKHLEISFCAKLQGLPETFGNLSSLERLKIVGCYLLERLPESFGNMGRSLKHLEISFCAKLQGLPETFGNLSSLERLEIRECDVLERLPESFGNMGRSLKHLEISFCAKLQGLPETFGNLSSLERLELERCDVLERLPESFVNIGPSLKHLEISGCAKLQGLPETFGNLSSLERLKIVGCYLLERLPESFGTMGRSLKYLEISGCAKLQGLPETFGNLSRLERLELKRCDVLERLPGST